MATALWIAHVTVTDEQSYMRCATMASDVIKAHGGEILARGGRYIQKEGADRARNVVVRYPSLEAANACYDSAEYQAALAHATGASIRELVLVEELD